MIKLLIKKFIRDKEETKRPAVREQYSILACSLGIILNAILFVGKLTIGLTMNSIAIISDAFNNLTDTSSSIISIIGVKMANKKPDKEHPFGHGRIEYIVSLFTASIIVVVGLELGKSSIMKIINPSQIRVSFPLLLILSISIFIKLWMFSFNKYIGKKIESTLLLAASRDSLNDVLATSTIVLSIGISKYLGINIDGYIGAFVSLLIIKSGIDITRDVLDLLIGPAPDPALVENLLYMIHEEEDIQGVHDLVVHEYGPGNFIASIHVEVLESINIIDIHEKIDNLTIKIKKELGIEIVIHMDPISSDSKKIESLYKMAKEEASKINDAFKVDNFRITEAGNRVTLIFDLAPLKKQPAKEKTKFINKFKKRIKEINPDFYCIIN